MLRLFRGKRMAETMDQEAKPKDGKAIDPFESFRSIRDAYLDAMSKTMIEAVNTESYAQATGAMLDSYLSASIPLRESFEKLMLQALQQLSLPSRQEVAALAERFTNVEIRLDDLDAKIDRLMSAVASLNRSQGGAQSPQPVRPVAKRD